MGILSRGSVLSRRPSPARTAPIRLSPSRSGPTDSGFGPLPSNWVYTGPTGGIGRREKERERERERVVGTQFSNLYTAVDTPAEAA